MAVEPDSIPDDKAFAAASYVITYGQFMVREFLEELSYQMTRCPSPDTLFRLQVGQQPA